MTPSSTICVLPWIHLSTTVDGVWGRCCFDSSNDYDYLYAEAEEPLFVLRDDAIGAVPGSRFANTDPSRAVGVQGAFDSPAMRRTRVDMLAGRRPAACSFCWDREDEGGLSHRQAMNRRFAESVDLEELIKLTAPDGALQTPPVFLDLRFGNRCNLACVMCAFPISSRWGAKARPRWAEARVEPYRNEALWDELEELAPDLRWIYFAGGEPFLQPLHYRMLDVLTRTGSAEHIDLHYNSNLTVLPETLFTRLAPFHHVVIAASCDGTGEVFEQIRTGARWHRFAANVRLAKQHVELWLDVTVQRDNVGALGDIIAFGQAEGVPVRLENLLHYPEELSIRNLPVEAKAHCRAELGRLLGDPAVRSSAKLESELREVVALLELAPTDLAAARA